MKYFYKYKFFILYFILGIINALALSAYPLIYVDKGFSAEMVTNLISISFFAMILQPLVGFFTDKLGDNIKSLKVLLVLYIISCGLMFLNLKLFIISLIINSITRNSLVPITDGYVTRNIDQFEFSYAQMRTAMPIGFGVSFLLSLIFTSLLGLPIAGILIFLILLGVIAYIIINSSNTVHSEANISSNKEVVEQTDIKNLVFLVLYFLLYAGLYQVSSSYLSMYMVEINHTNVFIGVLNLMMVIPQIYLLFNYSKLLGRLKNTSIMMIATLLGIIQALIYIIFSKSILLLIIASFLSGIQIVLFPASFFPQFTKTVKSSNLATYLTLNTSIQAVFVGLFNQMIVSQVYGVTNSIISVYYIVVSTMLVSFIPIFLYKKNVVKE